MTTRTSPDVATGVQPKSLRVGTVAVTATFSINAGMSLSAGDVIQMVKVPQGATPTYVALSGNPGGAVLVKVGDGVSTGRYITGLGASSGMKLAPINQSYVPYTYPTDDTIDIVVSTTSLSSASGAFNLIVHFTMDA
jgi:hypothetical protein